MQRCLASARYMATVLSQPHMKAAVGHDVGVD